MTKQGTIPCLVCGEQLLFLTTTHMRTHPPEYPQTDPKYKEWVAKKWAISEDDVPLAPVEWRERKHLFEGWREDTIHDYGLARITGSIAESLLWEA